MKINIVILLVLILGAGFSQADEIVLEDGKVYSGNVLNLTENTVSILVDNKEIMIARKEVHAVFLGEQTPFSSHGYPGLHSSTPISQQNVQKNGPKKK